MTAPVVHEMLRRRERSSARPRRARTCTTVLLTSALMLLIAACSGDDAAAPATTPVETAPPPSTVAPETVPPAPATTVDTAPDESAPESDTLPDRSESDVEVGEAFTSAFIDGDVDGLAALSAGLETLGSIPWRAEFLAALDLEADSVECVEDGTQVTCTIVGHNARTKLIAPDFEPKRSLHLTIEDGLVTRGSFEFDSPEMAPIFDAFNQWAFANRRDVIDGPCADIDATSDPVECAAAVLEVAHQYLAASDE